MTEYKDTLSLPKTGFQMRAHLATKEPKVLKAWDERDLYGQIQVARKGAPLYVMHDGPPYANGHLHHGHILNKILKDIVVRDRNMRGFRAAFIPGWDCHGLPIEVQVDKELGKKKAGMSKAEVRAACRNYAERFVAIQRDEFKRLGVLARWREPYLTMSFGYEATILRELAEIVGAGLLYKGLRPVNWCYVHQTALAEAEVEYEERRSPSIYVRFALVSPPPGWRAGDVDIVIWTTTPWTLPANRAVCARPAFDYVAYPVRGRTHIVARRLAAAYLAAIGEPAFDEERVLATWKGDQLAGLAYRHPLFERTCPIILGEHVTDESGTGLVHTAPGHGADDFEIGRRNGLEVLSPIDGRGFFTEEAGPFAGKHVFDANADIVAALCESKALLNVEGDTIEHRYAHCWRCHKPIITRATEQWFVALDEPFNGGPPLRERALGALGKVSWIPRWGEDRIRGMLEARPDWCLSRQRSWGVPIAVVYCDACNTPIVDKKLMNRVADIFEEQGADAWFTLPLEELTGPLTCEACGSSVFRKEEDIVDVWFESGVSYAAVIERFGEGHREGPPVDLYLEGSDQHRGWFHSSLLCALATRSYAPYRKVLTHGFFVDGEGKKISKSKGNFIDPFQTIAGSGAELLRLWVASEDYREDIRISSEILTRLAETYRKVRNTVRYLLGNVSDFDANRDMLPAEKLEPLDRYMLLETRGTLERMNAAYEACEFHLVMQRINELCTVELSAFYLDVLKDRLYASAQTSRLRRSAQTALYVIGRDLLRMMAPIFCFTAEEAWEHLPRLASDPDSVHLALHPGIGEPDVIERLLSELAQQRETLLTRYAKAREIRRAANIVLEDARKAKQIGSSTEAAVTLELPAEALAVLRELGEQEVADLLIVSQATLREGSELKVSVEAAPGRKCARCWLYRTDVGRDRSHPSICARCVEAL